MFMMKGLIVDVNHCQSVLRQLGLGHDSATTASRRRSSTSNEAKTCLIRSTPLPTPKTSASDGEVSKNMSYHIPPEHYRAPLNLSPKPNKKRLSHTPEGVPSGLTVSIVKIHCTQLNLFVAPVRASQSISSTCFNLFANPGDTEKIEAHHHSRQR